MNKWRNKCRINTIPLFQIYIFQWCFRWRRKYSDLESKDPRINDNLIRYFACVVVPIPPTIKTDNTLVKWRDDRSTSQRVLNIHLNRNVLESSCLLARRNFTRGYCSSDHVRASVQPIDLNIPDFFLSFLFFYSLFLHPVSELRTTRVVEESSSYERLPNCRGGFVRGTPPPPLSAFIGRANASSGNR